MVFKASGLICRACFPHHRASAVIPFLKVTESSSQKTPECYLHGKYTAGERDWWLCRQQPSSLVQYTCLSLTRVGPIKSVTPRSAFQQSVLEQPVVCFLTGDPSLPASGGDPGVVSLETGRQVRK